MCSIHFTNRSILFQAMFLHTDYTSRVHTWHNVSFITYFYKFGFFYTALYIISLDNINIKNLPEEFQAFLSKLARFRQRYKNRQDISELKFIFLTITHQLILDYYNYSWAQD